MGIFQRRVVAPGPIPGQVLVLLLSAFLAQLELMQNKPHRRPTFIFFAFCPQTVNIDWDPHGGKCFCLWSLEQSSSPFLKGILHQTNFYRLNLIFWIVMVGGAQKPPNLNICPQARKTPPTALETPPVCLKYPSVPLESAETPGDKFWDQNVQV